MGAAAATQRVPGVPTAGSVSVSSPTSTVVQEHVVGLCPHEPPDPHGKDRELDREQVDPARAGTASRGNSSPGRVGSKHPPGSRMLPSTFSRSWPKDLNNCIQYLLLETHAHAHAHARTSLKYNRCPVGEGVCSGRPRAATSLSPRVGTLCRGRRRPRRAACPRPDAARDTGVRLCLPFSWPHGVSCPPWAPGPTSPTQGRGGCLPLPIGLTPGDRTVCWEDSRSRVCCVFSFCRKLFIALLSITQTCAGSQVRLPVCCSARVGLGRQLLKDSWVVATSGHRHGSELTPQPADPPATGRTVSLCTGNGVPGRGPTEN